MAEITKFEPRRKKAAPCPICGNPHVEAYRPFCSRRCADVDLNRWLSDVYRVETDETPESEDRSGRPDGGGAREARPRTTPVDDEDS